MEVAIRFKNSCDGHFDKEEEINDSPICVGGIVFTIYENVIRVIGGRKDE